MTYPFQDIKNGRFYLGDCLEVMKEIPDESIHCIITDIPYGISFSEWDVKHENQNSALLGSSPAQEGKSIFKTRGKPKNGWSEADKLIPLQFQEFCEKFLKESQRILFPAGSVVAFTGRQFQHRFMLACENSNLIIKDTLAWNKTKAPFRAQAVGKVIGARGGSFEDDRRLGNLAPLFEPIVWAFKPYKIGTTLTDCYLKFGTGTFSTECLTQNIINFDCLIKDRLHETEKPLGLMEILVKTFSVENQVILDMFAGSGTTAVACENTNRKWICIEQLQEYADKAVERIQNHGLEV